MITLTKVFEFIPSTRPLLVSIPHAGTELSPGLAARLSEPAAHLPDTDWFVNRLYAWAADVGAGVICARFSRYVVDLNRPPDDARLYSGATTGLVPVTTFEGQAIYQHEPPSGLEVQERVQAYHGPYHDALEAELQRIHRRFGYALLLDAHSIRSVVPMLFKGQLPDLNLGSFDRRSADPQLIKRSVSVLEGQSEFSHDIDGRFKGGYITRHYGRPQQGFHALQLEIAQRAYMRETPPRWDHDRAARIQPVLSTLLESMIEWGAAHG
ncbi:MAG: N-formylglutamate deformylase [Gammaproteobacteria bacterium]|nr:N-formylglutamate deformylase [Gammaproteobacteria bacterium]